MTTIYAATNDQVLVATILPKIARNNINMVRLYVAFDSSWDDTVKSAVFYTSKNPLPYEVILSDGYCLIPQEVLAEEAKLYITVKGVLSTGAVKTSTVLAVKVLDGTPTVIISDPTPSVYQQMLTAISQINNIITHNNDTDGNTELVDIRVGANGEIYGSAGEAVRKPLKALLQSGDRTNPLQPLLFDQFYFYRGGTTAHNITLDAPQYNLTDLDKYKTIQHEGGTSFGIFGKLVSPISVFNSWTDKGYMLLVKSDKEFSAQLSASYTPAWGGTTIISQSIEIIAGYNLIRLTSGGYSNEGHSQYRYIGLYGLASSNNSFDYGELGTLEMYLLHGDTLLGLLEACLTKADKYITCWGDSLTAQAGWTDKVASLSEIPVYNAGTGGESVRAIVSRQGADPIVVNDITIPAGVEPITIATYDNPFTTALGYNVMPLLQGGSSHVNPVKIGDIEGTLKWTGSSYNDTTGTWTFTRSVAGEETVINRPTALTTAFDREKNSPHLMIIFMGQNGGYGADNDELVNLHRLMINHAKAKHTIILGLSSGSEATRASYEKAMKKAFGRYFISLREYLSKYGLDDAGLTATANDLAAMETGTVPPQLLADSVHYTSATKTVIGNLIYKRCRELGIFE